MKNKLIRDLSIIIVWCSLLLTTFLWNNPATKETVKLQEARSNEGIAFRWIQHNGNHDRSKFIKIVEEIGFSNKEAKYMYLTCTNSMKPNWCMEISSAIAFHETKGWTIWVGTKWRNNIYWMMTYAPPVNWVRKQIPMVFPNRMASFEDFINRYNAYWWTKNCNTMITESHYTTTQIPERMASCAQIQWKFYN